MKNSTKFSIVIPTRNRVDTLQYALNTCLSQIEHEDYEIVISDNSDGDDTEIYIRTLVSTGTRGVDKINYSRRISICNMADNFDTAVAMASGDYVIVIGDDDGILPMALYEINRLIHQTGAHVIKWRNGLFIWPDLNYQDQANYLGFCLSRSTKIASGREQLKLSTINFEYANLPLLYINAAVHRDVIAALRGDQQKIFRTREPDVYSGILLGYLCAKFLDVTVPFTLAGLSNFSTGVSASFGGPNTLPRQEYVDFYASSQISHHPHVPNMPMFPVVDFANSFFWAKAHRFPDDDGLTLPRRHLMQACVARADTDIPEVRDELLRVCADDAELMREVHEMIANREGRRPAPRLKPRLLGSDNENLHLDARDLGLMTIEDAVRFVHKIVWPRNDPLRYDLPSSREPLIERTALLTERTRQVQELSDLAIQRTKMLEETNELLIEQTALLTERTRQAQELSDLVIQRTKMLEETNELLIERTALLTERTRQVHELSDLVIQRTKMLEETNELLIERTGRLEALTCAQNAGDL